MGRYQLVDFAAHYQRGFRNHVVMLSDVPGLLEKFKYFGCYSTYFIFADELLTQAVARLRRHTDLPIAVGFGIKTPEEARTIAAAADAAVVGSAIVSRIAAKLDADGRPAPGLVDDVLGFVRTLADGAHGA